MADVDVSSVSISSIGRRILSGFFSSVTQRRKLGVVATLTIQSSDGFNERLVEATAESFTDQLQAEASSVAPEEIAAALNLSVGLDVVQDSIVTAEALQLMQPAAEMCVFCFTGSRALKHWSVTLLTARVCRRTAREAPLSKSTPCPPIQAVAPRPLATTSVPVARCSLMLWALIRPRSRSYPSRS